MEYQDSVFYTNGQSFDELAERFTISAAYGPAIANYNNYGDQDISTGKFMVKIPANWLKAGYIGKIIDLRSEGPQVSKWVIYGGMALLALVLVGAKP